MLTPAEVARINHEARLRILEYVLAEGVKPRNLGVTSSLLTKIKHSYRVIGSIDKPYCHAYIQIWEIHKVSKIIRTTRRGKDC